MSPRFAAWTALLILVQGCATQPGPAQLMQPGPQAAANREVQTRRFDDVNEAELLAACVSVLQDQGFRITASDGRLGVIAGTKTRSVADIQRAQLEIMLADFTFDRHPERDMGRPADSFNVVLATRSIGSEGHTYETRATFYRVWHGKQHAAIITSPALYQQFFGMLSTTLARTRAGG